MKSHGLAEIWGMSPEFKSVILSLVSQKGKGPLETKRWLDVLKMIWRKWVLQAEKKIAGGYRSLEINHVTALGLSWAMEPVGVEERLEEEETVITWVNLFDHVHLL